MRYRLQRTAYYFLKNLQGDIIAVVNENRETVARYRYGLFGGFFKNGALEVSSFFGINEYICLSLSTGVSWKKAYIKTGLLLALSKRPSGAYVGMYVEISVPTWLLAAVATVTAIVSAYVPAIGLSVAKLLGAVRLNTTAAIALLAPILPGIITALV